MPKYAYKCNKCDYEFEIRHSISEKLYDCSECEAEYSLERLPQFISKQIKKQDSKKPGNIVKEFIESNKEILKKQKTKPEDYKP